MAEKNDGLPKVYFPTDEAGRMSMIGVIDRLLGDGPVQKKTVGIAIPRKGKKTAEQKKSE